MRNSLIVGCGMFFGVIAFYLLFVAAVGLLFMLAWNMSVVGAFNAPALTFWQACGFVFLLSFVRKLFGSTSNKDRK